MPTYEYRCPRCHKEMSVRRPFTEMEEPTRCLDCGTQVDRILSNNPNIFIPIHMRSVLTGGAPGGGGLSWSDFHGDTTEKQLAHDPRVVPAAQNRSARGTTRSN